MDDPKTSVREIGRVSPVALAASRCPWCHADVTATEASACDRSGCGALYHVECWTDCHEAFGECAVYGCGATGRAAARAARVRDDGEEPEDSTSPALRLALGAGVVLGIVLLGAPAIVPTVYLIVAGLAVVALALVPAAISYVMVVSFGFFLRLAAAVRSRLS